MSAGFDSATCGLFDESSYPTEKKNFAYEFGSAHKGVVDALKDPMDSGPSKCQATVAPSGRGVASRTVLGDGSYDVHAVDGPEGQAIAATLGFDHCDLEFRHGCDEAEPGEPGRNRPRP